MPARTTVVYLGDNVYETGMPEPTPIEGTVTEEILDEALLNMFASRRDSERRVKAQVKAVDVRGARAHLHSRQPRLGPVRHRRLEAHAASSGATSASCRA